MDHIKAELEGLTFETPSSIHDKGTLNEINQFFNSGPQAATAGNLEDVRRISSQNYKSDILNDVFNRNSNLTAST